MAFGHIKKHPLFFHCLIKIPNTCIHYQYNLKMELKILLSFQFVDEKKIFEKNLIHRFYGVNEKNAKQITQFLIGNIKFSNKKFLAVIFCDIHTYGDFFFY